MPVYNAAPFLADSIASILQQTFDNWELICVDDGSSDESLQLLKKFARLDPRIKVFHQENSGIVVALQAAIEKSHGELLARMDADDIAVPDRLQMQIDFMRCHPEVVVVGGAALEIDADGDPLRLTRFPSESDVLVRMLLRRSCPLIHPSVMMRRGAVLRVGGYRQLYQWVEDYDLWLRLAEHGNLANISDIVLCYRQHASSVCWNRSETQRELLNSLMKEAYATRNLPLPEGILRCTSITRVSAGPGKWLRMALKGGYTRTARKHLRALWLSDAPLLYKCRMTVEYVIRWPLAMCKKRPLYAGRVLPNLATSNSRIARDPGVSVLSRHAGG